VNAKQKRSFYLIPLVFLLVVASWRAGAADMYVYFGTHRSGPGIGFSLAHFDTETGALMKPDAEDGSLCYTK